jgi:hypothetical protein
MNPTALNQHAISPNILKRLFQSPASVNHCKNSIAGKNALDTDDFEMPVRSENPLITF